MSDTQADKQITTVLSSEAIKALQIISDKSLTLRHTRTPTEKVKERKGKDGKTWQYIQRKDAMEWLDKNYPGWSFEVDPESFKEFGGYVCVTGRLTVIETGEIAFKRTIRCVGVDEIEFRREDKTKPVTMTYYKNAETDALKRCVFTLGGFSDVYTDDMNDMVEKLIPDVELEWFLEAVLPLLMKRYESKEIYARNIFKSMKGFMAGDITKTTLSKAFPELIR